MFVFSVATWFPVVPQYLGHTSVVPQPLNRTGQAAFPHPALHSNIQLRAKRIHVCPNTYPRSICAHSVLTP